MKTNLIFTICILLLFGSCKKDDLSCTCQDPAPCDQMTVVDNDLYQNGPDDEYFLREASIEGDCLYIRFEYGGGCEEVEYQLVGLTDDLFTPPQRGVRLSLKDNDPCEALITVETTFNLRPIRIGSADSLQLLLEGWDESLIYSY